jgi:glucokinase
VFCLVGDIGGTNARFAVAGLGAGRPQLNQPLSVLCADFATATDAIDHYLARAGLSRPPLAAIAVAGPIENGAVQSTNGLWGLSNAMLRAEGFSDAFLVNDYAALARAAPALQSDELATIGPHGEAAADATLVVLGAGTGFGVAALARDGTTQIAVATEGGHVGFAPTNPMEVRILALLQERFGRVSVERILSGPGLSDLHWALGRIAGEDRPPLPASEIVGRASRGDDDACTATVDRFCAIYGSVAGDIALTMGARGGVYLAGGIAPRLLDTLRGGSFRERFEAKGRFSGYMGRIPTRVILHPFAALIGAGLILQSASPQRSAP